MISHTVRFGGNACVHETAIVGGPPFWYERDKSTGKRTLVEAEDLGVWVGDDVEIFPLAIVVHGVKRQTRLERGVKVSHRAQIGHDVVIGEDSVIGCGSVVSGLSTIGKRCTLGVGVIVTPGVTIGDDCFVGAGMVVHQDLPPNTKSTVRGRRQNWSHLPWDG